jgi:histidinol-phosphate/aromatic aminotransferase/cobyric acid decarboxylase-like protein
LLANPLAPSLRVYEALSSELQLRRPAQLLEGALVERLAASESVPPDWIAIGAGIDDLLVALLRAFGNPNNVVLFPPTDQATRRHLDQLGFEPVLIPRSLQFTTDLERSGLPAFPPNALTLVQHPNDPTGSPTTVHDAVRMIRRSRLLVIDERHAAYGARTMLPLVREFDKVVVLRTFETWAGLTALPVAFAIGPPDVIAEIRAYRLVRVATAPLVAAHASLDDIRMLTVSIARIKDEKARLYRMLRKMNVVRPMPTWSNFVLTRIERGDLDQIERSLIDSDIRVAVPEQPELSGYLRISATSHDATAALRAALIDLAATIQD